VRAIVYYQQRAIFRNRHSDRAAPDLAAVVAGHPAGQELLVASDGPTVLEGDSDHVVARTLAAVPRAVKRHEGVSPVLLWKLAACVEADSQRGRVGFD